MSNELRSFLSELHILLQDQADGIQALAMTQYMRGKFAYFGIKTPLRRQILKQHLVNYPLKDDVTFNKQVINALWQQEEREFQYCALDILDKVIRYETLTSVEWLTTLIIRRSWWDTVDLFTNSLNFLLEPHTDSRNRYLRQWIHSENLWLRRTALIYFRRKKVRTDWSLLQELIEVVSHEDEFFIQKAIGWSLRKFSKEDKIAVSEYIKKVQLSKVAYNEAVKYL